MNNVVVYSGELATVTVTGLTSGTTYHLAVYGYNADRFCYNTASPARGSKTTTTSKDADSDITRVGGETAEHRLRRMYQGSIGFDYSSIRLVYLPLVLMIKAWERKHCPRQ